MTGILPLFLFGLLLGHRLGLSERITNLLNRATILVVIILLFMLGVTVGGNDKVFNRLPDLGAVSLYIAWSCILGSCVVAYLAFRWFPSREG